MGRMNTTKTDLDKELAARAIGSTVDTSAIEGAKTPAEVLSAGGALMIAAKGSANLAAVQLAIRKRSAELNA